MALTPFQLKSLRYDLVESAQIKYDDVLDELLDHYASLTEQKMETGISFNDASKRAWTELGAARGLKAIEYKFVSSISQQIRTRHMNTLKSYFQWPAFIITVLVGLLVFSVVPIVPIKWLIISLSITCLTPYLFLLWGYYCGLHQQTDTGKIVWKYMLHKGGLLINLFQLGLNLPNIFVDNGYKVTPTFLEAYPGISVLICLAVLLYTTSFIHLFRHQYKHQLSS